MMAYAYSLLLLCLMSLPSWAEEQRPQPSLTDVVLFANFPLSSLSPDVYTENRRSCAEDYLAAAIPLFAGEKDTSSEDDRITLRRWRLERHIKTILGMASKDDAEKFAAGVPLGLEWEGMSEGPMMEADYAEQWLNGYPNSPIKPFLHLFAAHRFRAAYEAASREHAKGLIPIIAAKYRIHVQEAQSSGNPMIICLAGEMDALPYVYLSGFGRP
jgi:hypothetical protein